MAADLAPGEPAPLSQLPAASANQKVADTIAEHLRLSGQLRHYTVDIAFHNGAAEVSGTVADQPQREEVLRIVQGVPGVERVVDRLTVAAGAGSPTGGLTRVEAQFTPPILPEPLPGDAIPPGIQAPGGIFPGPAPLAPGGMITTPPGATMLPEGSTPMTEPMPAFQAPVPSPYDLNPPKMPPYAWPTYAPYNNFARVAYPEAYPYNAWPFIGPIYPFPKVPLGWRHIKLEWDDGYWWYSKVATKYDWWRLRFH
jgi:hypothetical protein